MFETIWIDVLENRLTLRTICNMTKKLHRSSVWLVCTWTVRERDNTTCCSRRVGIFECDLQANLEFIFTCTITVAIDTCAFALLLHSVDIYQVWGIKKVDLLLSLLRDFMFIQKKTRKWCIDIYYTAKGRSWTVSEKITRTNVLLYHIDDVDYKWSHYGSSMVCTRGI